jgi:hypothetical protein
MTDRHHSTQGIGNIHYKKVGRGIPVLNAAELILITQHVTRVNYVSIQYRNGAA